MGEHEPPSAQRDGRRWVPYFVLLLCAAATAAATAFVSTAAERQDRARFDRAAERTHIAVANRMDNYSASLRNITALFQTGGIPNREQFHEYLDRLDLPGHYPGLQGIGFSLRFAAKDRELWAKTGRENIDPSFRLWPDDPAREDYHAVLYLEPLDGRNRRAIGFDMHTDPARAAAMDQARDEAAPVASAPVELVTEVDGTEKQAGFLIFMPLYRGKEVPPTLEGRREKLVGYIYAPFRADDLFRGLFLGDPRADIDILLYDGTEADPSRLLHDSSRLRAASAAGTDARRFAKVEHLVVSSRPWTIRLVTRPEFAHSSMRWLTPLVLATGVALSVTFFLLTYSQVTALRSGRRALARLQRSEAELRGAKDAAEAANRAKDEFLATLSHELRTPLNAILGWSHLLRSGVAGNPGAPGGEDLSQGLEVIQRNAQAQARLIEDLLDMSRIHSGNVRLDVQRVNAAAIVRAAAESARPAADAKEILLQLALDPAAGAVKADPARLQQVVWNLLSNAVKFTPPGGQVRVSVAQVDSRVEVAVSDTGEGIRPEFLPHVFDRFSQGDGTSTRRHGGLGLGLSIVKHLVELHGGSVRADSPGEGRGATFTISLPVMAESDAPGPAEPERPEPSATAWRAVE
jgi:signal transduction histidine kinase